MFPPASWAGHFSCPCFFEPCPNGRLLTCLEGKPAWQRYSNLPRECCRVNDIRPPIFAEVVVTQQAARLGRLSQLNVPDQMARPGPAGLLLLSKGRGVAMALAWRPKMPFNPPIFLTLALAISGCTTTPSPATCLMTTSHETEGV
jgi:hypothetical protein